jgi:hypothetical protein
MTCLRGDVLLPSLMTSLRFPRLSARWREPPAEQRPPHCSIQTLARQTELGPAQPSVHVGVKNTVQVRIPEAARRIDCFGSTGSHCSQKEIVMAEEMTKITSGTLIAAEKVEGTDVYNLQGEKLGTVDDIMIDKVSGKAIYALMSFGGFLGIGEKYHPLPWSTLRYDENKGGYVVNLDKRMLENAPTYDMGEDFRWTPDYGREVDKYYNAPTYWS